MERDDAEDLDDDDDDNDDDADDDGDNHNDNDDANDDEYDSVHPKVVSYSDDYDANGRGNHTFSKSHSGQEAEQFFGFR